MQRYRGKPVLTWWRGRSEGGEELAHWNIYDTSYRLIKRVYPKKGLPADIHEFNITARDTALYTMYHKLTVRNRGVLEGVIQEVDLKTGRLLFEWHSLDHVALAESYYKVPPNPRLTFDYFHINSIEVDTDGNLLVSARNTHTIYKINKRTGNVIWRLGGKRSDFTFPRAVRFAWQHDVRRQPDGTLTLFDNEAAPKVRDQSRGMILRLDMKEMRAKLVHTYVHEPPILAVDQGNMQRLPNGHFLIGWGHEPYITEFGTARTDAFRRALWASERDRLVPRVSLSLGREAARPTGTRGERRQGVRQLERRNGREEVASAGGAGEEVLATRANRPQEEVRDGDSAENERALDRGTGARSARPLDGTLGGGATRLKATPMLPGAKRPALAFVLFAFFVTACDDDSNKIASKTTTAAEAKGPPPPTQSYKSRPDLKPPPVEVLTSSTTAPGHIFFAPKTKVVQAGPMILDNSGQTVWFHPLKTKGVSDFKVQTYHGEPVLTWWRGRAPMGVGNGYYVISDQTYREIGRVYAGHKFAGDIHDFQITPRNTALVPVYHQVKLDLTQFGGPKQGRIFDGIVQEIDIPTGRVLFEWHSYPEVGLDESFAPPPDAKKGAKAAPWDYFHLNSIDVADDGNYILSARNSQAVYKLNRDTGKLMWRLGGKKSDFKMGRRHELRVAARRARAGRRDDHDLRQRRGAAGREVLARAALQGRRGREDSDAREELQASREPAGAVRRERTVPPGRERVRRLGGDPVLHGVRRAGTSRPRRALRQGNGEDHGAGPGRGYVPRVPLRVAGSSGRSSDRCRQRRHPVRELERRDRGEALAGARRQGRREPDRNRERREDRLRDRDPDLDEPGLRRRPRARR